LIAEKTMGSKSEGNESAKSFSTSMEEQEARVKSVAATNGRKTTFLIIIPA
jgi:hypothetical protein